MIAALKHLTDNGWIFKEIRNQNTGNVDLCFRSPEMDKLEVFREYYVSEQITDLDILRLLDLRKHFIVRKIIDQNIDNVVNQLHIALMCDPELKHVTLSLK